jgi:L-fuconolactonase
VLFYNSVASDDIVMHRLAIIQTSLGAEKIMPSKLSPRLSLPESTNDAPGHSLRDNADWRALHREEAIEPDRPIIDAHHHLWDRPGQVYLLKEYLADAGSGHNIRASVFVDCGAFYRAAGPEMMNRLGEVEYANGIAAIAAAQPSGSPLVCAAIVGNADLSYGAEISRLLDAQQATSSERFRGIRLITKWDPDETLNNGRYVIPQGLLMEAGFRAGFAQLGPRKLSFDAMVYHPQLTELIDLARTFPDTTIILNHIGGLLAKTRSYRDRAQQATAVWQDSMRLLSGCPNVYVKLGGLGMPYLGFGLNKLMTPAPSEQLAQTWGPLIRFCIDTFGPNRCMFESNFPPDRESVDFPVIWNAFKRIASGYSEDEKHALFFGSAANAYRLML